MDTNKLIVWGMPLLFLVILVVSFIKGRHEVPDDEVHFTWNVMGDIKTRDPGENYMLFPILGMFVMNLPKGVFKFSRVLQDIPVPTSVFYDKYKNAVVMDFELKVKLDDAEKLKQNYLPADRDKIFNVAVQAVYAAVEGKISLMDFPSIRSDIDAVERSVYLSVSNSLDIYGVSVEEFSITRLMIDE